MPKANIAHSLLLCLSLTTMACASGRAVDAAASVMTNALEEQTQSPAVTIQSFTAVDGTDLAARLEAARTRARTAQTPYWSAYSFDVRPGIAVDPSIHEFHG